MSTLQKEFEPIIWSAHVLTFNFSYLLTVRQWKSKVIFIATKWLPPLSVKNSHMSLPCGGENFRFLTLVHAIHEFELKKNLRMNQTSFTFVSNEWSFLLLCEKTNYFWYFICNIAYLVFRPYAKENKV